MSSRDDRRDKARDKLPPPSRLPQPLAGVLEIKEIGVASWCPSGDGTGPAEAVALHFTIGLGDTEAKFAMRIKSAARVDELIAMLERHRNDVWPGAGS